MLPRPRKIFGSSVVGRLVPSFLALAVVVSLAAHPSESTLSRGGFALLAVVLAVLVTAASRHRRG